MAHSPTYVFDGLHRLLEEARELSDGRTADSTSELVRQLQKDLYEVQEREAALQSEQARFNKLIPELHAAREALLDRRQTLANVSGKLDDLVTTIGTDRGMHSFRGAIARSGLDIDTDFLDESDGNVDSLRRKLSHLKDTNIHKVDDLQRRIREVEAQQSKLEEQASQVDAELQYLHIEREGINAKLLHYSSSHPEAFSGSMGRMSTSPGLRVSVSSRSGHSPYPSRRAAHTPQRTMQSPSGSYSVRFQTSMDRSSMRASPPAVSTSLATAYSADARRNRDKISELVDTIAEVEAANVDVKSTNKKLDAEVLAAKKRASQLESEIVSQKGYIDELEEKLVSKTTTIKELHDRIAGLEEQNKALKKEANMQRQQLEQFITERNQSESEYRQHTHQLNEDAQGYLQQLTKLQTTNADLQKKVEDLRKSSDSTSEQLRVENRNLQQTIAKLQVRVQEKDVEDRKSVHQEEYYKAKIRSLEEDLQFMRDYTVRIVGGSGRSAPPPLRSHPQHPSGMGSSFTSPFAVDLVRSRMAQSQSTASTLSGMTSHLPPQNFAASPAPVDSLRVPNPYVDIPIEEAVFSPAANVRSMLSTPSHARPSFDGQRSSLSNSRTFSRGVHFE